MKTLPEKYLKVIHAAVDALYDKAAARLFNRTPVKADMVLYAATRRPMAHAPLQVNTQ